jgi:hypothetical protein
VFYYANLSPLIPTGRTLRVNPLSDFIDKVCNKISRSERERVFERGLRPLSFLLPSPARNNWGFLHNTGWRGVRGEAISINHI